MRVLRPGSLGEALRMRAAEDVVPMAGGTDLLVHWPVRPETRERTYLDLWSLEELTRLRWTDGWLELGALVTYWDVIRDGRAERELPILAEAARQVGAIQIQARGTWGGNIANASPAADGVPVLMACDGRVVLTSVRGERELPLERFYHGYKEMDLAPDELVTAIRIPRRSRPVQRFLKVGARRAQAIAKVGLALARSEEGWRCVAASVAPTVRRCPSIEARLEDGWRPGTPDDILPAIRSDVAPIDDLRSSAAYREGTMARVLFHAWPDGGASA
ncbi:MAG TPA: FAD binding domain-containing protein [Gemmatimonadota bacterium]|nr:FAD binding domain-containing protein [Gemmatimonadota bacterium]